MENEIFYLNLRTARKRKNLTQLELAKLLDMKNKQSISDWESGKSMPKTSTLIKIAEILDVSLDWLVFGKFNQLVYDSIVKEKEELYEENQKLRVGVAAGIVKRNKKMKG